MDQRKIGPFLKELRKEKGITQEGFAEVLNVFGRTVSRWETGSNMPDISLVVEIAEYFDVSIPELINGERKGESMNDEVKDVAQKLSDYAECEKERIVKGIRNLSIIGVCALAVYFLLDITGFSSKNSIMESISIYTQTLVYVCTVMIPLYTTGILGKFTRKNKNIKLPKPVFFMIAIVVASVLSFLLKGIM